MRRNSLRASARLRVLDAGDDAGGLQLTAVLAQDDEFIPGQSGRGVSPPLGALQSVGELGQDLTAGGVTEGVVDGFEVVQIAEQQPDA